eukprot:5084839-Amphidinium_carterae.1
MTIVRTSSIHFEFRAEGIITANVGSSLKLGVLVHQENALRLKRVPITASLMGTYFFIQTVGAPQEQRLFQRKHHFQGYAIHLNSNFLLLALAPLVPLQDLLSPEHVCVDIHEAAGEKAATAPAFHCPDAVRRQADTAVVALAALTDGLRRLRAM